MMTVGDEQAEVEVGDLVLVPPQTSHFIVSAGEDTLIYASATAPPQSMADLYSTSLA